jgi:hypothetical protein
MRRVLYSTAVPYRTLRLKQKYSLHQGPLQTPTTLVLYSLPSVPEDVTRTRGHWLVYMLLLALPFPARVVRPDADCPVWFCKPKRRVKGVVLGLDLTGMPAELPDLPDEQYVLPELVGRLFDSVILSEDALRPYSDEWCTFAIRCLFRMSRVLRPLRVAVETERAAARAGRIW